MQKFEFETLHSQFMTADQPIVGTLVVPTDTGPESFYESIHSVGVNPDQGLIGVLLDEHGYADHPSYVYAMLEGAPIRAILTFGASSPASSAYKKSHLSVVATGLKIPMCLAKPPDIQTLPRDRRRWIDSSGVRPMHGHLGQLTLSSTLKSVTLEVE